MLCILEIVCSACGLFILCHGHVPFSPGRVVIGWPAYVIGILMTLVAPLIFGIGFYKGYQQRKAGQQNIDVMEAITIDFTILGINCGGSLLLALFTSEPIDGPRRRKKKKKNRRIERPDGDDRKKGRGDNWRQPDYDNDLPSRRSDADEDEDDEEDRRRRRRYLDDDDDDRPRRRR
jgi:hypothetical protein